MSSSHDTTGVLFLDDLLENHGSTALRAETWRNLGSQWLPPSVVPPAALVVVLRSLQMAELERLVPWLSLAEQIALVFDERQEPSLRSDEELQEVAALERSELAAALGNVAAVLVVERSLAESLDQATRAVHRGAAPRPIERPHPRDAVPPGPWIRLEGHPWTRDWLRLRCLRGALALDGSVALLDQHAGARVDLYSGEATLVSELGEATDEVVALPGARTWLAVDRKRPLEWRTETLSVRGAEHGPAAKPWGRPMGCSPDGTIIWSGLRCVVYWSVLANGRVRPWTMGRVRWPDTHAKKLFGHLDNIGLWVDLAPDASACLSVMEYDALLTPGPPVRWVKAGDLCVAQGVTDHPLRALFFQYTGLYDVPEEECVGAEEEVRGRRATMSLGPDEERRYVVGFDANTWRVIGERSERIGLAGGGYAVYDSQHRVTGWGPERMWAGWDRWLLLETPDGMLERLDLVSGEREALVPIDREVQACVAVPGSPNFVLVAPEGEGIAIRLV